MWEVISARVWIILHPYDIPSSYGIPGNFSHTQNPSSPGGRLQVSSCIHDWHRRVQPFLISLMIPVLVVSGVVLLPNVSQRLYDVVHNREELRYRFQCHGGLRGCNRVRNRLLRNGSFNLSFQTYSTLIFFFFPMGIAFQSRSSHPSTSPHWLMLFGFGRRIVFCRCRLVWDGVCRRSF